MNVESWGRWMWAAVVLGSTAGCATTGATLGSGVGDAYLTRAPFYAGRPATEIDPAKVGHLPVVYQRGASHAPIFDPSHSEAMARLLTDMAEYLDAMGVSTRLVDGGRVSAVTHRATGTPPDVRFGCEVDPGSEPDECAIEDGALGRGPQTMHLAVGRPSAEWVAWIGEVAADQQVEQILLVTLEVGHYRIRQRGLRGSKEVELGTSHIVSFPWLTSLETSVAVLQLTGALVGPDGKAIRIGAEGLLPQRTSLTVSSLGGQALITDEQVAELRTLRREDLPGRPLVWQAGLRTLVESLTGAPARHVVTDAR